MLRGKRSVSLVVTKCVFVFGWHYLSLGSRRKHSRCRWRRQL